MRGGQAEEDKMVEEAEIEVDKKEVYTTSTYLTKIPQNSSNSIRRRFRRRMRRTLRILRNLDKERTQCLRWQSED